MLSAKKQNYHHSKLPALGDIGKIALPAYHHRKCQVIAFPLCDNILPYSIGIHTCIVQFFDNMSIHRFSGIWFES